MQTGFTHLGPREVAAVILAIVIIVDWAAIRYRSTNGEGGSHSP